MAMKKLLNVNNEWEADMLSEHLKSEGIFSIIREGMPTGNIRKIKGNGCGVFGGFDVWVEDETYEFAKEIVDVENYYKGKNNSFNKRRYILGKVMAWLCLIIIAASVIYNIFDMFMGG